MNKKVLVLIMLFFFMTGCATEVVDTAPRSIDPTLDICPVCRMSIIDEHFGGQIIDTAGAAVSFDDTGCLAIYLRRLGSETSEKILAAYVKDFRTMEWIAAKEAYFVQGQIDTPMSFGIVAFAEENTAREFAGEVGGKQMNWEQVLSEKLTIGLDVEFDIDKFAPEELSPGKSVPGEGGK